MPLKLNVGLMKKIGQPRYSSLSASCHLEIELESSLLERDAEGLQDRIRRTFAACRRAVDTELAIGDVRRPACLPAELDASAEPTPRESAMGLAEKLAAADRNGKHRPAEREPHGGSSMACDAAHMDEPAARPASASQLSYVRRLASGIGRAAALRIEVLAQRRFGKPRAVRVFVRSTRIAFLARRRGGKPAQATEVLSCRRVGFCFVRAPPCRKKRRRTSRSAA